MTSFHYCLITELTLVVGFYLYRKDRLDVVVDSRLVNAHHLSKDALGVLENYLNYQLRKALELHGMFYTCTSHMSEFLHLV